MGNEKEEMRQRLLRFSVMIIRLANKLPRTPAGFAIAGQIVRSGTSIGANCEEAQDAVSRNDFLNKLSIALKEARESLYWLKVIMMTGLLGIEVDVEIGERNEIISILVKSVKTVKSNEK